MDFEDDGVQRTFNTVTEFFVDESKLTKREHIRKHAEPDPKTEQWVDHHPALSNCGKKSVRAVLFLVRVGEREK